MSAATASPATSDANTSFKSVVFVFIRVGMINFSIKKNPPLILGCKTIAIFYVCNGIPIPWMSIHFSSIVNYWFNNIPNGKEYLTRENRFTVLSMGMIKKTFTHCWFKISYNDRLILDYVITFLWCTTSYSSDAC